MSGVKRDCVCLRAAHMHGTRAAYQKDGCRCFPCRFASHLADQAGRHGEGWSDLGSYVPRCGVVRRIEALHTIGWSEPDIAARLGVTKQAVHDLRTHRSNIILRSTAARIADVYNEMWDGQPPAGYATTRTRNWAARKGFVPPLAWDDDTIDDPAAKPAVKMFRVAGRAFTVDRQPSKTGVDEIVVEHLAAGGYTGASNRAERREAVLILAARGGLSDREIGKRVGLSIDAVLKLRHRHDGRAA